MFSLVNPARKLGGAFLSSLVSSLVAITFAGVFASSLVVAPNVLATSSEKSFSPVNINRATTAQLAQELSGIGLSKAEAIVRYREQHGAFRTVEDLANVKGIGLKTVEKLRAFIVAGEYTKPAKGESLAEQETAARAAVQGVVKQSLELRNATAAN